MFWVVAIDLGGYLLHSDHSQRLCFLQYGIEVVRKIFNFHADINARLVKVLITSRIEQILQHRQHTRTNVRQISNR